MNFYRFIKGIQDGVGCDCRVNVCLWGTGVYASGFEIQIDWENDFHYRFVVLECHINDLRTLAPLQEYVIHDATKKFKIAEVGEE